MQKIIPRSVLLFTAILLFARCTKTITDSLAPPIANAGPSQVVLQNSTTVTGSGNTTNGHIVGYLWSLISGPNVPVITSPSNPTTTITNLITGSYRFQFAVIDEAGLTGIDTISLLVQAAAVQTLTLQPSNNALEGHVDSYFNSGGSTDTEIPVGAWTISGNPITWREFIQFDQTAIPAGATILSANLTLYGMPNPHGGDLVNAHSGTSNSVYVERITGSWAFGSMTWASQPASTTVNRASIGQSASSFEDNTVNVTNIVKDMQTNGNYGFKIYLQTEVMYNIRQWASSYHSNAALHPKLVITYQ